MATDPFEKFPPFAPVPAAAAADSSSAHAHAPASAPASDDRQSSPGAMLRNAREAAGLSIGDVATRLRMGVRQVDALERADYVLLPTGTFLRGMVRNYAKMVHVDADAAIRVLESTHTHAAVSLKDANIVVPSHNIKLGGGRAEPVNPKVRVAITCLVLVLLGAAAWYWWQYVRPNLSSGGRPVATKPSADKLAAVPNVVLLSEAPTPALAAAPEKIGEQANAAANTATTVSAIPTLQPENSTPLSAPPMGAVPAATPATRGLTLPPAGAPIPTALVNPETANIPAKESTNLKADPNAVARPAGSSVLAFKFTGESWIDVVDGRGKALVSRRFKAGETSELVGRAPFSIVVGNAAQVKMTYNGNDFDLTPHTRVAVARVTLK